VTAVLDHQGLAVSFAAERLRDELGETREGQRREDERKDRVAARQSEHDAAVARIAARVAKRDEIHASVRPMALQLGFAWCCTHEDDVPSYLDDVPMCEASGWDRGEYDAHMRGHGAKAPTGVKLPRLRKRPPAASLPKLACSPFKFITWTETHTEPGICECGHTSPDHASWHGNDGITVKCEHCDCRPGIYGLPPATTQTAERRGQYWANGPDAHSVWVIPFELAPWENGRPAPVLLYAGSAGKFHQHAYSAKYDRR
jgi:hypothetical protein